ncbi:hypothetical protein MBLNU13_g09175t1 [Cladosporium sp. NU13]
MFRSIIVFLAFIFAFAQISTSTSLEDDEYDFIVVGSGAGGGPLACRLAEANFKTLLIEAGNDQGDNVNTSIPAFQGVVAQDPKIRWDMFVNHYPSLTRAQSDPKYVYSTGPNQEQEYTGLHPPPGAKPKGILYPRAGVLGGCVSHNALIWILPHRSDWEHIANLTGDASWRADAMETYVEKVYEWLHVEPTNPAIVLEDLALAQHMCAGAAEQGWGVDLEPLRAMTGLGGLLMESPNDYQKPKRDSTEGFFQIPLIMKNGARRSVRERILDTIAAGHPLTLKTDTFVTRVLFDEKKTGSSGQPKATGVAYLSGSYLYKASPLSRNTTNTNNTKRGTPGTVHARKEVILSGGAFNTPQLLKLSGIGSPLELSTHSIPLVHPLPGVGTNLQDRYEIPVTVSHTKPFHLLKGCTFDAKPHDACYAQWASHRSGPLLPSLLPRRGPYATNGLAAAMVVRSETASTPDTDLFIFGGPINFVGYYPQWGDAAVADHSHFSWYALKAHTRNTAGTVRLRSADPLEPPVIDFNYFDTGTTAGGADSADLAALVQAVNISRRALERYRSFGILGGSEFVEEKPGAEVQSEEAIGEYVKENAWGHHASCTTPIGADGDPMAVLDAKFRVRGVDGLRVVDASVFPKIPGVFIQAPIYIVSEKAAGVIIEDWGLKETY